MNIRSLHDALIRKQISAEEVTSAALSRIEKSDLNAFITVTAEEAMNAARNTDRRIAQGEAIGMLEGIPMSLKDNLSTRGIRTTCASRMLRDYIPVYDSFVRERLKEAGSVLLGKTNMDEFGFGSTGTSSCFGAIKNPHSPHHVSGGSSGGSAAAVADREGLYSIGTDTGGSVRQPAAFCGVVGFKPSYGVISRYGLITFAAGLDHIGILAGCAEDVRTVFETLAVPDPRDSTCIALPNDSRPPFAFRGKRIGVLREEWGDCRHKPQLEAVLRNLEAEGAEIDFLCVPEHDRIAELYYLLSCAQAASDLARFDAIRFGSAPSFGADAAQRGIEARSAFFGDEVKHRIMIGNLLLSSEAGEGRYRAAEQLCDKLRAETDALTERCDFFFSPVALSAAYRIGELRDPVTAYKSDRCTVLANLCGLPSVSLPCGTQDGLPVSFQLTCARRRDRFLLDAAIAYQAIHPTRIGGEEDE